VPVAVYQPPRIKPTLDWVLFRRRSGVDCRTPVQQVDIVTLYAANVSPEDPSSYWNDLAEEGGGDRLPWLNPDELQFKAGSSLLVTPAETVRDWWSSNSLGNAVYGAAYAPAGSTDPVPIDRAQNLVTALAPAVSGTGAQYVALPTAPSRHLPVNGAVGALYLVALQPS
jgi:hypothetical protein